VGVLAYPLRVFSELDRERRRIEAALHDGVQQDLAATAVRLELAQGLLETDPEGARRALEELRAQVEEALGRVRELAESVYPAILLTRGLTAALRSLDVEPGELERYPLEVEEAVYFSCRGLRGRAASARAWQDGDALRVELTGLAGVEDDELAQVRSRIATVGGHVEVAGDRVSAAVPLR
jgi:hypothetical protein